VKEALPLYVSQRLQLDVVEAVLPGEESLEVVLL